MSMERAMRMVVLPGVITVALWVLVADLADRQRPDTIVKPAQITREVVVVVSLVAIWLTVVAAWAVGAAADRSERRRCAKGPRCAGCGYNLRGIEGRARKCPECGRRI
jgi:hypothetical protein